MTKKITKRLLPFILAMTMVLPFISVPSVLAASGDKFDFQILFTSDIHGCFSDKSYSTGQSFTGMARIATKINEIRDNKTILVDVGDAIQGNGTSVFHTARWDNDPGNTEHMYPVLLGMKYLNYDAVILGNHEFNFGFDRLDKAYNGFGNVLAGNLYDSHGDKPFDSFYIKDFTAQGGPRVAIIGMTHPNSSNWDAGNFAAGGYSTRRADQVTAETIAYLKGDYVTEGNAPVDIIVAAQHISETTEYSLGDGAADVLAYGDNAKDLSLFIGAHGHTNVDKMVNGVRFVELASNGARLGQVKISATQQADNSWKVADKINDVKMTNNDVSARTGGVYNVAADPGYMNYAPIKAADEFASNYANEVIGELTGGPLVPAPELKGTYQAYLQDNALVHRINEAMLYYANSYVNADATLKSENTHAKRGNDHVFLSGTAPLDTNANAQPGPLTRGNVSTIYKYDNNTLCIVELTGAQFKKWMEWAYLFVGPYNNKGIKYGSEYFNLNALMLPGDLTIPYGNGNMPGYNMDQFEGVTYKVDLTKAYGSRITNIKNPDGTAFNLTDKYWVAVNNYRADSQLLLNAAESSRPAVFPGTTDHGKLIARDVDAVLTVNDEPKNNGEGMLGLMIDWINRVKNGVITNEFTKNWEYVTPYADPRLRAKAVEKANQEYDNGNVDYLRPLQVGTSEGYRYAKRAVTIDNVVDSSLDIFSFNDFHGAVDKKMSSSNPGADRFVAIAKELMSRSSNPMIVSAGDSYQGSPLSNVFEGKPVSDMIKTLGVEISAIGNHEFDWGQDKIPNYAADGDIQFLAANIFLKGTENRPSYCEPYAIKELAGKKIGFIGLTTVGTVSLVKADAIADLDFRTPGPWLNTIITDLKDNKGCDFVIALTHFGSDMSGGNVVGEAADLARDFGNFDGIISGHTHKPVAGYVNGVPIVQGNYNGRGMARLNISYLGSDVIITPYVYTQDNMNTADILPVGTVDTVVRDNIAAYYEDELYKDTMKEIPGTFDRDISTRDIQAEWATKIVADYIRRSKNEAYVLFQNAGGWRDTSPYPGNKLNGSDVYMEYLYTLMPFDNEIILLPMKGKDLIYMLNLGVNGGGVQTNPPTVVSAQCVNGAHKVDNTWYITSTNEPIENDKIYKVACNDFMYTGGDRYPFPNSNVINAAEFIETEQWMGVPLRTAMVEELRHRQTNDYVTLVSNGGTGAVYLDVLKGGVINSAPTVTKTGFKNLQWYSDAALENPVVFPYTMTGETTWYAGWESLSDECNVVEVVMPANAVIASNSIDATVPLSVSSSIININVSDFATWALFSDAACQNEILTKKIDLSVGDNVAYIKVTAEDGTSSKIYPITITREANDPADVIGVIGGLAGAVITEDTIDKSVANNVTTAAIDIEVAQGATWALYSDAECLTEIENKSMQLLVGDNVAYIKVTNGDVTKIYTVTVNRAEVGHSPECELISVISPADAEIEDGMIVASVSKATTELLINVEVSPGATWDLYSDIECLLPIANKTMTLVPDLNMAFIKVTAEDGVTSSTYVVAIDRALLSDECDIVSVLSPTGATVDIGKFTKTVPYTITQQLINVKVSTDATWDLYSDLDCRNIIPGKLMTLNVGTNVAYVRVTAEDNTISKVYRVEILREAAPILSDECEIIKINAPLNVALSGNTIRKTVNNSVTSQLIDVVVSDHADWELYSDLACTNVMTDKKMTLHVGDNTAYICVTAEDGVSEEIYTVIITRLAASDSSGGSRSGGGGGSGAAFSSDIVKDPTQETEPTEPIEPTETTEPTTKRNIVMSVGKTVYTVDGKSKAMDVAPFIVNDRTVVPVRFVAEALGAKVDWDDATKTVTITLNGKTLKLVIGQDIPGFEAAPFIKDGRTFVPISYVSQFLGAKVTWVESNQSVQIDFE